MQHSQPKISIDLGFTHSSGPASPVIWNKIILSHPSLKCPSRALIQGLTINLPCITQTSSESHLVWQLTSLVSQMPVWQLASPKHICLQYKYCHLCDCHQHYMPHIPVRLSQSPMALSLSVSHATYTSINCLFGRFTVSITYHTWQLGWLLLGNVHVGSMGMFPNCSTSHAIFKTVFRCNRLNGCISRNRILTDSVRDSKLISRIEGIV